MKRVIRIQGQGQYAVRVSIEVVAKKPLDRYDEITAQNLRVALADLGSGVMRAIEGAAYLHIPLVEQKVS